MQIYHHISINSRLHKEFFSFVKSAGIGYHSELLPGGVSSLISFDITESDSHWRIISEMVKSNNALDISETFFTNNEILASEWARLIPVNLIGYPQPEKTWTRDHNNYDNYCSSCGTYSQKSAFTINENVKIGKSDFGTLYWTYALLCTANVCKELKLSLITGFECTEVLMTKKGISSEICQIVVAKIIDQCLVEEEPNFPPQCETHNLIKFPPQTKGVMKFRRSSFNAKTDFVQTFEWFGSGRSAYREILISNRLASLIINNGWKGIRLKVVDLV